MSAKALHEKALEIVKTYLRAEAELIDLVQKIDQTRSYRELGYRSLYDYATQGLGLGANVAYNLITVARKALEIPLLKEKLVSQEITLSNARMIAPVITPENQEKWLSAAQDLSKRELEREVARVRPELMAPERTRFIQADRIKLEMGLSPELHEKLRRAQDLVSSRMQKAASLEDTLESLVGAFLEREDPLLKARRVETRKARRESTKIDIATSVNVPKSAPAAQSLAPGRVIASKRKPFQAALKHAVIIRDGDRCTHRAVNGERCSERRWLDTHHIQPVSQGGQDRLENLVTLCSGHHQLLHARRARAQDSAPDKAIRRSGIAMVRREHSYQARRSAREKE